MTTTSELLLRWDQSRARAKQVEMGMSEVGGCRRRAGYRLAQIPPSDAGGSVQAAMGSAIHDAIDAVLASLADAGEIPASVLGRAVEYAGLPGHYDRFENGVVVDTKTTSSRWAEHLRLHGPDESHLWQVHLYGAALVKAGEAVTGVQIDYLARDTGDEWSWSGPFEPQVHVRAALLWLRAVRETPLDMLPRDYMPDSQFCHSCRFATLCWPYGLEGRGPAKVIAEEGPCLTCDLHAHRHDVADHPFEASAPHWADELWRAKQAKKAAEATEERARLALEALRPMTGTGLVDAGEHRLKYGNQLRGTKTIDTLRFVSKRPDGRAPAVGYEEGDG